VGSGRTHNSTKWTCGTQEKTESYRRRNSVPPSSARGVRRGRHGGLGPQWLHDSPQPWVLKKVENLWAVGALPEPRWGRSQGSQTPNWLGGGSPALGLRPGSSALRFCPPWKILSTPLSSAITWPLTSPRDRQCFCCRRRMTRRSTPSCNRRKIGLRERPSGAEANHRRSPRIRQTRRQRMPSSTIVVATTLLRRRLKLTVRLPFECNGALRYYYK